MGMNDTPSANRVHIGFFGCRNAGKSSVVNAVTAQELSVVSAVAGTTTDPVQKAMEILPLGPVVVIDTPGIDDVGGLGEMRVARARRTLNRVDVAVLVVDATKPLSVADEELVALFQARDLPFVVVHNKCDLVRERRALTGPGRQLYASALPGEGIFELKEAIGALAPIEDPDHRLLAGLVGAGAAGGRVWPIGASARKGRIILPQQQAIRDALDYGAHAMVVREHELAGALEALRRPPALVVTDSQAFGVVAKTVPDELPLTSFSILMANYKGFLMTAARGVAAIDDLTDGDVVLMAEGCTHHRQCNDIGTVKIPRWLRAHTGADISIETSSGRDFPEDLSRFALVVHCGGCMISEREVTYRMRCAIDAGVPFTNYGLAIARMTGTLERSVRVFPEVHEVVSLG